MRRRVVVTGMGCVTPIGNTVESMWKSLQEGRSGIDQITHFDASSFPTKFAAEVKDFDLADYVDDAGALRIRRPQQPVRSPPRRRPLTGTPASTSGERPTRFGVYLGAGEGQQDFFLFVKLIAAAQKDGTFDVAEFTRRGLERLNPGSRWSRSRTCRPATWPACSTPRARTPTA